MLAQEQIYACMLPQKGNWFEAYRLDPVTQLMGFPDFHRSFPNLFYQHLAAGNDVGIAIGDVDKMKHYVECTKAAQPWLFGHLAGNALMSELGNLSLNWIQDWDAPWAALSSFGGDEIILVAAGLERRPFALAVRALSNLLSAELPCSVSFAYGWFTMAAEPLMDQYTFHQHYVDALVLVDRALFKIKARRIGECGPLVKHLVTRSLCSDGWAVERESRCVSPR